jgi:hypothetical protein
MHDGDTRIARCYILDNDIYFATQKCGQPICQMVVIQMAMMRVNEVPT